MMLKSPVAGARAALITPALASATNGAWRLRPGNRPLALRVRARLYVRARLCAWARGVGDWKVSVLAHVPTQAACATPLGWRRLPGPVGCARRQDGPAGSSAVRAPNVPRETKA